MAVNVISESVFTVGGHGVHTAFLEDVALLRDIPDVRLTVNSLRRADLQHVHTVGPLAMGQLLRAKGRSVVTAHLTPGSVSGSLAGDRYWAGMFMRHVLACYNLAGAVLAVNDHIVGELKELGVRAPIVSMPNTVDVTEIRARRSARNEVRHRLGIPDDAFTVVCVGQLQPRKEVQEFVRSALLVPEARFFWVGGPIFKFASAARRTMTEIVANPPPNLVFTGQVSREEVLDHLAAADLFFMPSRHENCPMAVLEAVAMGLPLLLRDIPQYRAILGEQCLYGNDDTFASLIRRCLESPDLTGLLAQRSLDVAWRFDSSTKAARLVEVYDGVLAPSPQPNHR